jgi:hypothetical protein
MNQKILFNLLTIPTAIGAVIVPFFAVAIAAQAKELAQLDIPSVAAPSCDVAPPSSLHTSAFKVRRSILVASSSSLSGDNFSVDFSEAESDAAVQLFGCDCPACIRSLHQLQQNQSLSQKVLSGSGSSGSQGHCLASLQRRMSPQAIKNVLKTLETQKPQ